MQSLLQPLQLPSSIATRAHASLLPWQHRFLPILPPATTTAFLGRPLAYLPMVSQSAQTMMPFAEEFTTLTALLMLHVS